MKLKQKPLYIELRVSKVIPNEIGLFASRNLPQDFIISKASDFKEKFISWANFKTLDHLTRKRLKKFCLYNDKGIFLMPNINLLSSPWFMNHSCDYNIGLNRKGDFVTARKIRKDEELTLDYGMLFGTKKFRMKCYCTSVKCRKIITGEDFKDPFFLAKNKKYILKDLILKASNKPV